MSCPILSYSCCRIMSCHVVSCLVVSCRVLSCNFFSFIIEEILWELVTTSSAISRDSFAELGRAFRIIWNDSKGIWNADDAVSLFEELSCESIFTILHLDIFLPFHSPIGKDMLMTGTEGTFFIRKWLAHLCPF